MCHVPKKQLVASRMPAAGGLSCNPGYTLMGNQTGDLSVCRKVPNPLNHTSQGGASTLNHYNNGLRTLRITDAK